MSYYYVDWMAVIAVCSIISSVCSVVTVLFVVIKFRNTKEQETFRYFRELKEDMDKTLDRLYQNSSNNGS